MDEIKLEVELARRRGRARAPGDDAPAARPARARRAGHARACCRAPRARRAGWSTSARQVVGSVSARQRRRPSRSRSRPRRSAARASRWRSRSSTTSRRRASSPATSSGREEDLAGGVRRQPPDAARGAQAARQRQPDPRQQGPGRRHLRRPHRRPGHEPQPQRRHRDDARDRRRVARGAARRAPAARGAAGRPGRLPAGRREPGARCARPCAGPPRRRRASDPEALAATDAEFHRAIAAAAGNRMLQALTDWIFEVVQPSLIEVHRAARSCSRRSSSSTRRCCAAIEKGDAARAERAMKDHLLYLRDVLRMVRASG